MGVGDTDFGDFLFEDRNAHIVRSHMNGSEVAKVVLLVDILRPDLPWFLHGVNTLITWGLQYHQKVRAVIRSIQASSEEQEASSMMSSLPLSPAMVLALSLLILLLMGRRRRRQLMRRLVLSRYPLLPLWITRQMAGPTTEQACPPDEKLK
mgnify:CR=1 FL=1|jgi:hypothetical protein